MEKIGDGLHVVTLEHVGVDVACKIAEPFAALDGAVLGAESDDGEHEFAPAGLYQHHAVGQAECFEVGHVLSPFDQDVGLEAAFEANRRR